MIKKETKKDNQLNKTTTDGMDSSKTNTNHSNEKASSNGLSTFEVTKRLNEYGYNEITEKRKNSLIRFLENFWGPIPWMIEVAIIISAIIGHWYEFFIISVLLIVNGSIKFFEEHQADNAISMLKNRLAPNARVFRNGNWETIPARELVPGDKIRVRLGDIVPADTKLTDGNYLLVDESALTGESLPVEHKISDIIYSGAIVKMGEMNGRVISTGMNTYFGKTTRLLEEKKPKSHFQKAIVKIGDFLIAFDLVLVVIVFIIALFRHESFLETLQFALVLTVASIPVALPAILSVTMAIGARKLASREAIVSKLVSIEEMASVDVLCTDKTGTITRNELTVANLETVKNYTEDDLLLFGSLASREEDKDPIDEAIITKANELDGRRFKFSSYKVDDFKPFDPVSKHTEAIITDKTGNKFKVAKGAPQVISNLCNCDDETIEIINDLIDSFAEKGYRSLAVAKTNGTSDDWHVIGLFALFDPPREDSAETIKQAQAMGLRVIMITGDHIAIAKEIAKKVNLGTKIKTVQSLKVGKLDQILNESEDIDGFAQVLPENKFQIISTLQNEGHIVGMTGDGVNDAPALNRADVGIAVANATDAARSAADIALTKPGLSVIVDAIKTSREIFQRMLNYSLYRITETVRIILFITLSIIFFNFYPITAIMVVLLALLNDAPIMTIAFDNVKGSDKPEKWNIRELLSLALLLGIIGVISSFLLLYVGQEIFKLNQDILQSFIYLKLSVAGHLTIFVTRTKGHFWSIAPSKVLLIAIIGTQIIATIITVYGIFLPAMGWNLAIFVWVFAIIAFFITDFLKMKIYDLVNCTEIRFLSK